MSTITDPDKFIRIRYVPFVTDVITVPRRSSSILSSHLFLVFEVDFIRRVEMDL
jgi:hypothetical protein